MPISATSTAEPGAACKPRVAILALSQGGSKLGRRLADELQADFFACKGRLAQVMAEVWPGYSRIVCIMATGIVVRTIAPLLTDKYRDPAVVVCDELGRFVISLISGHLGGANVLAHEVAAVTGGQAVLTTASDVLGRTALDLWCRDHGLSPVDKAGFTRAMARLVDRGSLTLWSRFPLGPLPPDLLPVADRQTADLVIDYRIADDIRGTQVVPKALVVGIGCNRGTPAQTIAKAVQATCEQHQLHPKAIARLASIDLKQDEVGLLAYGAETGLDITFYSKDQLNGVAEVSTSEAVLRATGAKGVAEPAALLCAGVGARLLVPKMKWIDTTTAVAEMADPLTTTSQGTLQQ
nr:cobalamin biosynthesis protein [uncultured Desulfobulbus sp.]